MELFDKIRSEATGFVKMVAGHGESGDHVQTVTIERGRGEVEALWRDPDTLSSIFGEGVKIRVVDGIYEWSLPAGADQAELWRSELVDSGHSLRFVTDDNDADNRGSDRGVESAELVVSSRDAPNERGTELTLKAAARLPAFFTASFLFGALYRARALLQTGEVPTLAHNPSARGRVH